MGTGEGGGGGLRRGEVWKESNRGWGGRAGLKVQLLNWLSVAALALPKMIPETSALSGVEADLFPLFDCHLTLGFYCLLLLLLPFFCSSPARVVLPLQPLHSL